jgi:hypothetical protein
MPKFPAGSLVDVRIGDARNVKERTMLGHSYLVDRLKRHVIVRDHVDLHKFAQEIGISSSWPGAARQTGSVLSMAPDADAAGVGPRQRSERTLRRTERRAGPKRTERRPRSLDIRTKLMVDTQRGAVSPSAQAYGRAVDVWGQWLRHWRLTRDGRALRAAFACEWIAKEKFAIWQAELKVNPSVWGAHAERAAREQLAVHKVMRQIRRDQRLLYTEIIAAVLTPKGGSPPKRISSARRSHDSGIDDLTKA